MSEATETIVQKLTAQRTLLVDVVHQIEAAIKTFGGTITTPNGNGTESTKGKGSGSWWATASPAKRARFVRRIAATKRANRLAREEAVPQL